MPSPRYREHLDSLRQAFPQPVSDPVHDSYVVFSILRALDQVDSLKSQAPILGTPTAPDYAQRGWRKSRPMVARWSKSFRSWFAICTACSFGGIRAAR